MSIGALIAWIIFLYFFIAVVAIVVIGAHS